MKVLVIGGTGDIGKAVVCQLRQRGAEVVTAGFSSGDLHVDIASTESLKALYEEVGMIDAVVCATGKGIPLKPLFEMNKEDFIQGIQAKLLGQIDVVLIGLRYIKNGGSFTLTTGVLNEEFIPNGCCIAMINSAVEGFVCSGALELPRNVRLNVVSPKLVEESAQRYKDVLVGFDSMPAKRVALTYLKSIYGVVNAKILKSSF